LETKIECPTEIYTIDFVCGTKPLRDMVFIATNRKLGRGNGGSCLQEERISFLNNVPHLFSIGLLAQWAKIAKKTV